MKPRIKTSSTSCRLPVLPAAVSPLIEAARRAVRAVAPGAVEAACRSQKPRSPSMMWKLVRYTVEGDVVLTIGTFTRHASMFFARGAELEDDTGLLEGSGKALRYITLRTPADAKSAAVKAILRNAFDLAEASEGAPGTRAPSRRRR